MTTIHFTDPGTLVDVVETADAASVLVPLRELDAVIQQMAHNLHAGRLSISSSDPVGQSATPAGTLYLLPYGGNVSAQRNASGDWIPRQIPDAGVSLDVTALAINTNYDVFEYDNSGNIALEALAWASNTARATALAAADGVYLKTGATTRKYRGTIRTVSDGGTPKAIDSNEGPAKAYVFNAFNRIWRKLRYSDATASWAYSTGSYRSSNNNAAAVLELVNGLVEDAMRIIFLNSADGMSGTVFTGIGWDSTAAAFSQARATVGATMVSQYTLVPAIGYHYAAALEYGAAGATFYGGVEHALSALWRA